VKRLAPHDESRENTDMCEISRKKRVGKEGKEGRIGSACAPSVETGQDFLATAVPIVDKNRHVPMPRSVLRVAEGVEGHPHTCKGEETGMKGGTGGETDHRGVVEVKTSTLSALPGPRLGREVRRGGRRSRRDAPTKAWETPCTSPSCQ
jgi:hypothetical protein